MNSTYHSSGFLQLNLQFSNQMDVFTGVKTLNPHSQTLHSFQLTAPNSTTKTSTRNQIGKTYEAQHYMDL